MYGIADWMYVRGTQGVVASEETLLVRIQRAAKICKPYADAHPDDVYGWLLYGMSLGIQARVDLARKHWIDGAIHGYRGIAKEKNAEHLSPEMADVQLAMGTFHYYVGMSGALLRTASRLMGLHGTTEQGRRELQYAAENGRYGSQEALGILMYITGYLENGVPEALAMAETLTKTYPESPYYWAMQGDLSYTLGDTLSGNESLDSLRRLIPGLDIYYQREYGNKVTYLLGVQAFKRGEYRRCIRFLEEYVDQNTDEYDFHGLNAQILLGRAYINLGKPAKGKRSLMEVANDQIPSRLRYEAEHILESLE